MAERAKRTVARNRLRARAISLIAALPVLMWPSNSNTGSGRPADRDQFLLRLSSLPNTIIWAWERPEDLRSLPPDIGVSFLAETVTLSGNSVRVRPRLQDLKVMPGTPLEACARIESDTHFPPTLTPDQILEAASAIEPLEQIGGVIAVQVDFDAAKSERAFYAGVLNELRRRLRHTMPLSITALTSWCVGDPWIKGLPVDEAVPMLFRMGPDAQGIRLRLSEGRDFSLAVCRQSVGISTDEPIRNLPSGRRVYVFRPQGWSPGAIRCLLAQKDQP